MSQLPQRKKTPEEIARLRDSLGVPAAPPSRLPEDEPGAPVDKLIATNHQAELVHVPSAAPPPADDPPAPAAPAPKPVHSLKRSERPPPPAPEPPAAATPLAPMPDPRQVRSLRKSEQAAIVPRPPAEPEGHPKIPMHRHSDAELNEIRRREALAMLQSAAPNPKLAAAHPAMIAPGYVLAVAGACCFVFEGFPLAATAACAGAALIVAAAIVLHRPISRHHAAFIAIIALFVMVFGALHYFPQLRHAT